MTRLIMILTWLVILPSLFADPMLSQIAESNLNQSTQYNSYFDGLARKYQAEADYYKSLSGNYRAFESLDIPAIPIYNPWKGTQIGFGGGGNSGNTNTSNAQGNLLVNYKPNESDAGWNFNSIGQFAYLFSNDDGVQKNRLYLQQNGYYMFNKYNGLIGQASYLRDITDGYNYTFNENIGYQLQLFRTNSQSLLISLGPGLQQRQASTENALNITEPSWLSQFTYNLTLANNLTFDEQLQNIATQMNTTTTSISAITIKAYKNFGISLNYQFSYYSVPEPSKAAFTSISGVNFVYSAD